MPNRLVYLAMAIAKANGAFHDPDSQAFRLRNPLLLKCYSPNHQKDTNSDFRVFKSFTSGLDNAVRDLEIKCSGLSRMKLKPSDPLKALILCYGYEGSTPWTPVVKFLKHIAEFENVGENTKLSFFLDKE